MSESKRKSKKAKFMITGFKMAMYVRHNTNESTEFMTNTQLGLDGALVGIPAQTGSKITNTMI